jgi:gluconate kinase
MQDKTHWRVGGRRGHYMKPEMIAGQLAITEAPCLEETDVLPVDAEGGSPKEIADFVAEVLYL